MRWVFAADKLFSVIGNSNATTYVEIFPRIQRNEIWKGATANASDMVFGVPKGTEIKPQDRLKAEKMGYPSDEKRDYTRLGNSCWFTNLDHGRRHEPLSLMTMADNLRFSKHADVLALGYQTYVNIDAIEVGHVDAIPSDYPGLMGVPITFLDKYDPEQFEIVGSAEDMEQMRLLGAAPLGQAFVDAYKADGGTGSVSAGHRKVGLTKPRHYVPFKRILIRHRDPVAPSKGA